MGLCLSLCSAEAASALRRDMEGKGWQLDRSCAQSYVRAMACDPSAHKEALSFIKDSNLVSDEAFLVSLSDALRRDGHLEMALEVCAMGVTLQDWPSLCCRSLHTLGALGKRKEMEQQLRDWYGDDLSTVPPEVLVGVANGLCQLDCPGEALDMLTRVDQRKMHPSCLLETVALLLEIAEQRLDTSLAITVFGRYWESVCYEAVFEGDHALLHRAVNAAMFTQALLRLRESRCEEGSGDNTEAKLRYMERDFVEDMRAAELVPDARSIRALMLLSCSHADIASYTAAALERAQLLGGHSVTLGDLLEWTQHCGPLLPSQALPVIEAVRLQAHKYDVPLSLDEYRKLLSISYLISPTTKDKVSNGSTDEDEIPPLVGSGRQAWKSDQDKRKDLNRKALVCVRTVKNMMNKQGILCSTEAYNILLEAVARIEGGDMGAYFTTCGEMIEANVPSDLHTYHITLRACVRDDGMRSARQASVHTWRCFVKERPKIAPDIELMNLFISCALRYNDSDRAFFFLGVIDQWNLSPNALTFNLLLKACRLEGDTEKEKVVKELALKCLPPEERDQLEQPQHTAAAQLQTISNC